jgi:hypothetical protein
MHLGDVGKVAWEKLQASAKMIYHVQRDADTAALSFIYGKCYEVLISRALVVTIALSFLVA